MTYHCANLNGSAIERTGAKAYRVFCDRALPGHGASNSQQRGGI
jgi:hypothetical protein